MFNDRYVCNPSTMCQIVSQWSRHGKAWHIFVFQPNSHRAWFAIYGLHLIYPSSLALNSTFLTDLIRLIVLCESSDLSLLIHKDSSGITDICSDNFVPIHRYCTTCGTAVLVVRHIYFERFMYRLEWIGENFRETFVAVIAAESLLKIHLKGKFHKCWCVTTLLAMAITYAKKMESWSILDVWC